VRSPPPLETLTAKDTFSKEKTVQRNILVALDGSTLAEGALPHAVTLAHSTGSGLILLRVVPMPPAANPLSWAVSANSSGWAYYKALVDAARADLARIADSLQEAGLAVQTKLAQGDPAEQIIQHAQQHADTAMIVVANHGRSGLGRWMLGAVAEKVLQAAPAPLLLIRAAEGATDGAEFHAEKARYSTILAALDGSAGAEQALDSARLLAGATGATLLLVAVAPELEDRAPASSLDSLGGRDVLREQEKQRLAGYLAAVAHRIAAADITVQTRLATGDAAEELLRAARDSAADLIVMATHGRGGVEHPWLGSVAVRVAHAADRPVLLVRADAGTRRRQESRTRASAEPDLREHSGARYGEPMARRGWATPIG
jgi:nucleotide-binding universal stress UspA family protein